MKRRKKISLMLEAVENGDYTFRYPEKGICRSRKAFNHALNRIVQILSETRQEIRQQEIFYEQILQEVDTGILVLDADNTVIRHNKAASRLLGMESILHLRQLEHISVELAEAVSGLADTNAQSRACPGYAEPQKRAWEKNAQTVAFDNERGRVRLSVRVSLMRTAKQALRIVALNDIENELDEKEVSAWIRLTRVLTHEIMNAVTPLTSLSETLLEGYRQTDDRLRDGLQTIRDTGKGLLQFVESYRRFTHPPEPEPAPFYVKGFLQKMLELLRHQPVWYAGIEARIYVEPADLMVYADERLIGQVVLNILKNACQAMEERKGKLLLHAYAEASGAVRIELSNNGPAIEAALMEDIFLPFFTTKPNGSGIGLAVSRQLMHLCGGSILLHSDENLTTFTLLFP